MKFADLDYTTQSGKVSNTMASVLVRDEQIVHEGLGRHIVAPSRADWYIFLCKESRFA